MGIAVGCKNLNHALTDLNDGNIKGTAAQVVYHNSLLFFIVKSIGQGCRRRLVDNTLYIQTGDLTGILGGLTLSVVKVSGNRDNGLRYLFA